MLQFHQHKQTMSCWIVGYLRCHSGWHGIIMALEHPWIILGAYRDTLHEIKGSLDGFTIRRSRSSHPSLEKSISIATILKIPKLQDYLVLAVVVRELSQAPVCFLFDCCGFTVRFVSLSSYSSVKIRI